MIIDEKGGESAPMTQITREELDAKLDAVKSESKATSAELQREMHALRSDILTQFAQFRGDLAVSNSAVSVSVTGVQGKVEAVSGSIDGLKSSLSTMQFMLTTALAVFALYVGYEQLKVAQAPPAAAPTTTTSASQATATPPTPLAQKPNPSPSTPSTEIKPK